MKAVLRQIILDGYSMVDDKSLMPTDLSSDKILVLLYSKNLDANSVYGNSDSIGEVYYNNEKLISYCMAKRVKRNNKAKQTK